MPKPEIALVDLYAQVNMSSEELQRCSGSSKRRKMASSLHHITNLPEGIFEHVAKYLAAPSILCAAVAFTAASEEFYSMMSNGKKELQRVYHHRVKFFEPLTVFEIYLILEMWRIALPRNYPIMILPLY